MGDRCFPPMFSPLRVRALMSLILVMLVASTGLVLKTGPGHDEVVDGGARGGASAVADDTAGAAPKLQREGRPSVPHDALPAASGGSRTNASASGEKGQSADGPAGAFGSSESPEQRQEEADFRFEGMQPTGTLVISGRSGDADWRLYVWRSEKEQTCVGFYSVSSTEGGGSGTCEQRIPLGISSSRSRRGRFVYGLVTSDAVQVGVEYADKTTEALGVVSGARFKERFYAGALSASPVVRVVAVDSDGQVVAERRDLTALNS